MQPISQNGGIATDIGVDSILEFLSLGVVHIMPIMIHFSILFGIVITIIHRLHITTVTFMVTADMHTIMETKTGHTNEKIGNMVRVV